MLLRYENPQALWGLLGVALLWSLMLWQRRRYPGTMSVRRFLFAGLGLTLCVLALARPQTGHYQAVQRSRMGNLFLALDVSRSMLAEDVSPSRLGFTMAFTRRLLETMPGVRVALFPFAADGYLQMPLSTDMMAASDLISSLNPSMVTDQGTDFNTVLDTLMETINHMQARAREEGAEWAPTQVLLISDGETHRPVDDSVARRFRAEHIPIFTVGVGTTDGAFIPVEARFGSGRENLRDREGRTVRTKMDPDSLRKISRLSDGDYFPSRFEEVYPLAARLTQSMQIGKLTASFKAEKELFPILLVLAVICFAIELAGGRWEYLLRALLPLALLAAGAHGSSAWALSDDVQAELDRAGSRRGVEAYNLGVDRLKKGALTDAAELFQESVSATRDNRVRKQALYNLGNTLMRMSDPTQALQVYQLALDTRTGDAKFEADANGRISDNIVLAVQEEQKMRQQQGQSEGQGDPKDSGQDPHGPEKYQPQQFDEAQKQRMFDLVSGEEQQILQRQQGHGSKKPISVNGKEW
jgi:Ca-activated chloride channel family protein